jgi:hypothetical protein
MTKHSSYRVERKHGCRLIFGNVPLREMASLMSSGRDDEEIDLHLASLTGATLVSGMPDALAELRQSDDLPLNPLRVANRRAAEAAGLPERFCEWLSTGERGISSDYIAHRVTGIPETAEFGIPRDSEDFKRCLSVIEALREHAAESDILGRMGDQSQQWRNLSENWSTLKDMDSESSSQCSSFMGSLFREAKGNV